jgi:hypothetical protein
MKSVHTEMCLVGQYTYSNVQWLRLDNEFIATTSNFFLELESSA